MSDVRIPDPIDAAVRRAAAALPAQAWDFDALRSRRLHRPGRWRWLAGVAAGAVAVVVAGSAVLSPSGTGPVDPPVVDDTETPPDASLVPWIFAVDPDHLYANRADCRDCTERLVRSDD